MKYEKLINEVDKLEEEAELTECIYFGAILTLVTLEEASPAAWLVRLAWVGLDEAGVLADALPDPEDLLVQLALQINPDTLILPRLGEALSELPDSCGVGDGLGVPEEPAEAEPVSHPSLLTRRWPRGLSFPLKNKGF